jgi:uncharacterized protein (TIGR02145 family)
MKKIMKTKILFTVMAVAVIAFSSCSKDNNPANADENDDEQVDGNVAAPLHAASTRTWTFGEQTWSDVINIPECDKDTYESSYTTPQCYCNSSVNSPSGYLYNWIYVNTNAAELCPSPWRVPSHDDLNKLINFVADAVLEEHWYPYDNYGSPGIWSSSGGNEYDSSASAYYKYVTCGGGGPCHEYRGIYAADRRTFRGVRCVR